jgi:hypothetical protein
MGYGERVSWEGGYISLLPKMEKDIYKLRTTAAGTTMIMVCNTPCMRQNKNVS